MIDEFTCIFTNWANYWELALHIIYQKSIKKIMSLKSFIKFALNPDFCQPSKYHADNESKTPLRPL